MYKLVGLECIVVNHLKKNKNVFHYHQNVSFLLQPYTLHAILLPFCSTYNYLDFCSKKNVSLKEF
jgi:hypothetical protein